MDIAAYDAISSVRERGRLLAVRQVPSPPLPQRGHEGDEHPNGHAGEAQRSRQSRLARRGVRKHENDGEGGRHHGHDNPIRTPDAEGARHVRLAIAQRYARKELEHICDGREEIVDAPGEGRSGVQAPNCEARAAGLVPRAQLGRTGSLGNPIRPKRPGAPAERASRSPASRSACFDSGRSAVPSPHTPCPRAGACPPKTPRRTSHSCPPVQSRARA